MSPSQVLTRGHRAQGQRYPFISAETGVEGWEPGSLGPSEWCTTGRGALSRFRANPSPWESCRQVGQSPPRIKLIVLRLGSFSRAYLGDRSVPALPFGPQTHLSPALHRTGPPALSLLCSPLLMFPVCSVPLPEMSQRPPNKIEQGRSYETYRGRTPSSLLNTVKTVYIPWRQWMRS